MVNNRVASHEIIDLHSEYERSEIWTDEEPYPATETNSTE